MELNKNSQIFGAFRDPDEEEKEQIELLIKECPVALFQAVNKRLSKIGLCCLIISLAELRGKENVEGNA